MQDRADEIGPHERRFAGRQSDRTQNVVHRVDGRTENGCGRIDCPLAEGRWRNGGDVGAARNACAVAAIFRRLRG
ncbi:hypothetical protein [Mesorhizobium sp. SP-1A]|uniref:hypothetical protein n=1 Tax=Mesorhizobium sp. SP-1A TaxID=3077840 RepID=UPI0039655C3A